jgi:hypothetical protein
MPMIQALQPNPLGERTHSLVLPAIRPRGAGDARFLAAVERWRARHDASAGRAG